MTAPTPPVSAGVDGNDDGNDGDGDEHWQVDDGDTVCRLFDQSGHSASMPTVPLPGLPLLASPRHVACHEALPPAPAVALTLARGPPFSR